MSLDCHISGWPEPRARTRKRRRHTISHLTGESAQTREVQLAGGWSLPAPRTDRLPAGSGLSMSASRTLRTRPTIPAAHSLLRTGLIHSLPRYPANDIVLTTGVGYRVGTVRVRAGLACRSGECGELECAIFTRCWASPPRLMTGGSSRRSGAVL